MRARLLRAVASSPRKAGRSVPRRRSVSAGMPSSASTRAARRCSESSTGLCSSSASRCAARIDSWAFWVKRSRFIGVSLRSCLDTRVRLGDLAQELLCRGSLPALECWGQDDLDSGVEITGAVTLEAGHALAAQTKRLAGLSPRRDLEQNATAERVHLDLVAKQGFAECDWLFASQVGAAAGEDGMGLNLGDQVQIPGVLAGAGLPPGAALPAGLDASRNLHLEALTPPLDQSSRAVESFLEREVHLHLDVLAAARAPVTRRWLSRMAGA